MHHKKWIPYVYNRNVLETGNHLVLGSTKFINFATLPNIPHSMIILYTWQLLLLIRFGQVGHNQYLSSNVQSIYNHSFESQELNYFINLVVINKVRRSNVYLTPTIIHDFQNVEIKRYFECAQNKMPSSFKYY